jgi:hypothetical protein
VRLRFLNSILKRPIAVIASEAKQSTYPQAAARIASSLRFSQ